MRSAAEEQEYGGLEAGHRVLSDFVKEEEHPEPQLWNKGSDIFRMVSDKLEAKTANVASLFRRFDENKDGTVDYHELRQVGSSTAEPQRKGMLFCSETVPLSSLKAGFAPTEALPFCCGFA